ncbi:unnamed protein product [Ambrosiozyma monospora]|uniref:Unnamed protein product n=1 Tax=Ambrosiozyma monospora TaxID=43982 RepID=A0ACB5U400_AMBMO|nr:unnamed protein product [Ambrosiozyma monospora]
MSVWLHEYRDIIIGGLYGHMNIDHFFPLDSVKSWKSIRAQLAAKGLTEEAAALQFNTYGDDEDEFDDNLKMYQDLQLIDEDGDYATESLSKRYEAAPQGKVTYLENIRDVLLTKVKGPKKGGLHGERYAFAHVTTSVIPTFNPGIRVWEYNISSLYQSIDSVHQQEQFEPWSDFFTRLETQLAESDAITSMLDTFDDMDPIHLQYSAPGVDKTIPPVMPAGLPLGPES